MASITTRYKKSKANKGAKVLDGWDVRSNKIKVGTITFHCPASRYSLSDATKRREIIEAIEENRAKGKAASSDTMEEILTLGDSRFLEWLTKYGIIKQGKALAFQGLLDDAIEGYKDLGTKPQSLGYIKRGAGYFVEYLKERGINPPIASINKALARDFWGWLKAKSAANKWKPSTLNAYLRYVKQVFKWGVNHYDEMNGNPFDCVDGIVDTREKKKEFLSEEQAREVLEALKRSDNPRFLTALFLMGYRQGLRVWSEAPRLRWGFIDFEGRRMMIEDAKRSKRGAKKTREMLIHAETAEALRLLLDYRREKGESTKENDYIFSEMRKPSVLANLNRTGCKRFQKHLERVEIDFFRKVKVGTMRRAASNYWREKVGRYWENIFLGHSQQIAHEDYYSEETPDFIYKRYLEQEAKAKEEAKEEAKETALETC